MLSTLNCLDATAFVLLSVFFCYSDGSLKHLCKSTACECETSTTGRHPSLKEVSLLVTSHCDCHRHCHRHFMSLSLSLPLSLSLSDVPHEIKWLYLNDDIMWHHFAQLSVFCFFFSRNSRHISKMYYKLLREQNFIFSHTPQAKEPIRVKLVNFEGESSTLTSKRRHHLPKWQFLPL